MFGDVPIEVFILDGNVMKNNLQDFIDLLLLEFCRAVSICFNIKVIIVSGSWQIASAKEIEMFDAQSSPASTLYPWVVRVYIHRVLVISHQWLRRTRGQPLCAIREQRKLPLKWIYKIDGEFSRRAPIFRKAAQHLESMFGLCMMLLAMGLQLGDCPPVLNIWCKDTDNLWCTQKISLKFYVHAINKPIFLYRSNESCIFIRQNRKNFAFCFVYRLFLRTFANDHRYDVQVWTPVWLLRVKTITALAVIRRVWNVTVLGTNANDNWLMSALMAWTYHLSAFRYLSQPQTRISVHAFFVSVWLVEYL